LWPLGASSWQRRRAFKQGRTWCSDSFSASTSYYVYKRRRLRRLCTQSFQSNHAKRREFGGHVRLMRSALMTKATLTTMKGLKYLKGHTSHPPVSFIRLGQQRHGPVAAQ
jgi:hypothetical protein